eukprot:3231818-Pleurochrysis_carterae.AAC.5
MLQTKNREQGLTSFRDSCWLTNSTQHAYACWRLLRSSVLLTAICLRLTAGQHSVLNVNGTLARRAIPMAGSVQSQLICDNIFSFTLMCLFAEKGTLPLIHTPSQYSFVLSMASFNIPLHVVHIQKSDFAVQVVCSSVEARVMASPHQIAPYLPSPGVVHSSG